MPLYEYQCPECGRFERIQKFADAPLTECPTCGQGVQRLLSAPAIQFKGSGWYVTDYARKGGNGKGEKAGAAKAGDGAKSDGGSASKSESGSSSTGSSTSGSGSSSSS